ncbi:hypothetical protein M758_6G098600 [Ceratodon purpureus]|nr:hypothetical protein M758_6G098600 [Ceratodon purpureus]
MTSLQSCVTAFLFYLLVKLYLVEIEPSYQKQLQIHCRFERRLFLFHLRPCSSQQFNVNISLQGQGT